MAHSVDPDQTAPSGAVWSGSALSAYVILSETLVYVVLGFRTITVITLKFWAKGIEPVQSCRTSTWPGSELFATH